MNEEWKKERRDKDKICKMRRKGRGKQADLKGGMKKPEEQKIYKGN